MACLGAPTGLGLVITAVPVLGFSAWLVWSWLRAMERLSYAQSPLLWFTYAAMWLAASLSTVKLLVQMLSWSAVAWNVVSLLHSSGLLAIQVAIISLLLHGFLGSFLPPGMKAQRTTALAAGFAGVADAGVRAALLWAAHVPLYYIQGCITTPENASHGSHHGVGDVPPVLGGTSGMRGLQALLEHHRQEHPHLYDPRALGWAGSSAGAYDSHGAMPAAAGWLHAAMAAAWSEVTAGSARSLLAQSLQQQRFTQLPNMAAADCGSVDLSSTKAGWPYLFIHSLLLGLAYGSLLLLPFTPLRSLLPAKRALRRYLAATTGVYATAALGALLAMAGSGGGALGPLGVCLWSLCMWALDAGYAPLLYGTFLWAALSGRGGAGVDDLDEDLMYYSEMRDAGVLETDDGSTGGSTGLL